MNPEPFADGMTEELITRSVKSRTFVYAPHVPRSTSGKLGSAFAWGFTILLLYTAKARMGV